MPDRSNRRKFLSGLCATGLGGLAGCLDAVPGLGSSDVGAGSEIGGTDRTIKLGIMKPLSGDLESVGGPIRDAAELPIKQVEDEIDLEIDYEVADTETSPSTAVQEAARLVDEGYPMINGPADSDVTLQTTQQVLIPHRVVSCSPAATTPTITSLNDAGLVFRTAVSDSLQGVALAQQAATDLGHGTAATLYVDTDYGWQLSQAFSKSFRTDHGGTVSAQVPVERKQGSYETELETAMEDNPDLLIVIGNPETGAQLFDDLAARSDRNGVDVLVTDGLRDGDLHEETSQSIDGIRGTAPVADGPGNPHFTESFKETYDAEPGIFTAHAYDATAVLLLANAYAGQNDGTAIRSAMQAVTYTPGETVGPSSLADGIERAAQGENVAYEGASSPVNFDGNGDVTSATFEYWEFDERADDGITTIDEVTL
ncbi:ABC transporter substrate-binding protein [Halopiger djelfimassiliensis]|uniref:ABC transporter substrate-binding protein n=1 Tax=Halopiger djelfimassiliensis TaxID=1293047 RepID=UPI0006776504|nr:ABC transporter substrate-binding protein [Halopiger djelfimassiliensis]